MYSGRVGSSCSTSDFHRVTLVTNPEIKLYFDLILHSSHENSGVVVESRFRIFVTIAGDILESNKIPKCISIYKFKLAL